MPPRQDSDRPRHLAPSPQEPGMAARHDHYPDDHRAMRWQVPASFNIAQACCRRWAGGSGSPLGSAENIAIIDHSALGNPVFHSYGDLQLATDRLTHVLRAHGVRRGDRVAIVMPQRFETAVAYMAVLQTGAVAVPLSMLFGPQALEYRLRDSDAVLALGDPAALDGLRDARPSCPALATVIGVGTMAAGMQADLGEGVIDGLAAMAAAPADAPQVTDTAADDPAVLIYTSGTTGAPKGALIPHRALIGNLSGFVCSQNGFGFAANAPLADCVAGVARRDAAAVFWSPADWAWTGGLMDALLPTLYFGQTIIACRERFSPEAAFALMQRHGVTHSFLFPTALKAMMKAFPAPRERFELRLQALMSAGEAVGKAVFDWCRDELGVTVNEMFGQTEVNYIVGNCSARWPAKPGSMGRGYPGHRVAVIDDAGNECATGESGDVAVNRHDMHGQPDPVFFLGYWKNEAATAAKFTGDWCRTGDIAVRDADGYLWYQGRADDVFKSAGYRIGPGEIENCLLTHPAVANAAVVPKPDAERGALVKAYVVMTPETIAERQAYTLGNADFDDKLRAALQAHVRGQLAPYEYPKEIEFIDVLPMTTTGKVQRRVLRLREEERFKSAA